MTQNATMIGIASTPAVGTMDVEVITFNSFHTQLYSTDLTGVFFGSSDFGESCSVYHAELGTWTTYQIIFDDPHASAKIFGDGEFNSLRPQIQIIESSLTKPIKKADRIKYRGITYLIDDFTSDGVGITTIYLRTR